MAAINQLRYSQQYEKLRAQGLSHDKAHLRAAQLATPKPVKAKKKKESRIKRLSRLMKMAALGRHYKSEWQREQEIKRGLRKRL